MRDIEYSTPQSFFDKVNKEFRFNLDPAAADWNAKCPDYFTYKENGLARSWRNRTVWLNPPYAESEVKKWIKKAYQSALEGATVVCLLQVRSLESKWFHDYGKYASEIRLIQGRLNFTNRQGESKRANFGSMLLIFKPESLGELRISFTGREH